MMTTKKKRANEAPASAPFRAGDLMERHVTTVGPDAKLHEIAALFEQEKVGGLPVIGDRGELLGVVSQTDLARAVAEAEDDEILEAVADLADAEPLRGVDEEDEEANELAPNLPKDRPLALSARSLMSESVVTAKESETAGELAARMLEHGIHRVIVLRDHAVVGVVTTTDLLRPVVEYEGRLFGARAG